MENFSNPKISIVMPLYNSEKFIETAVESVLTQTFKDFELILIDDCSTDSTIEIISKYDDPRIKFVRKDKNSGESASRNLGIKTARGKYIYFADHDDAMLENTLEIFYNAAEESGAEVVFMNHWYDTHDSDFQLPSIVKIEQESFADPTPRFLSENLIERLRTDYIDRKTHVTPWLKIQRLDFLRNNDIYFPLTTLNGDVLFHFAELAFGKKLQVIDACCYVRRIHPNRTMDAPAETHLRKVAQSLSPAIQYLREVISKIQIPESFRIEIESEAFDRYFRIYLKRIYSGDLPIEKIDSILSECSSADSDLTRVLVNAYEARFVKKFGK
ncbi:MAG: glycosyltransferase [Selenomonadaceae bacterium]|nr:glycosyltransferase [Selenomonadaceae bacterium]